MAAGARSVLMIAFIMGTSSFIVETPQKRPPEVWGGHPPRGAPPSSGFTVNARGPGTRTAGAARPAETRAVFSSAPVAAWNDFIRILKIVNRDRGGWTDHNFKNRAPVGTIRKNTAVLESSTREKFF